ncbi:hypothetical protein [Mariniblastus fucicola]|uniref:Uncharacterized protein n=1 Tax=Mariniblastus fucicola TaxID=980251 RepID=A0A5B9PGT0_9BACT|nr:hypothetical protein [Mariniblastus fucicola]QEG21963.1 hypothetical protein MFFC18_18240 [Mariniblastus fucicola]
MGEEQNPYKSPAGKLTGDEIHVDEPRAEMRPVYRFLSGLIGVLAILTSIQTAFDFVGTEYFWRFTPVAIWQILMGGYGLWLAFNGTTNLFVRS